MTSEELTDLIPFCRTDRQREVVEAIISQGSNRAAARFLGLSAHSTINGTIDKIKRYAAAKGHSPQHDMTRTVPEGFSVKGVSTYYDEEGKPRGQWVKSVADKTERSIEALREHLDEILEGARGTYQPKPFTGDCNDDILCCYPIADAHLGLYAWVRETGEDYDTNKAYNVLVDSMAALVESAPPSKTAVIEFLGDFFHADNMANETTRSHHKLDVDTRWARNYLKGKKAVLEMVRLALTKHEKVEFRTVKGNHDDHSAFTLAVLVEEVFKNEPRVTVHLPYKYSDYYQFGTVLVGMVHQCKNPGDGALVMATDAAEIWGKSRFRYLHTAHIHHKTVTEKPGCVIESFRSPSAKDAYTIESGYRADRDLVMIKYHKERGEIGRNIHAIF